MLPAVAKAAPRSAQKSRRQNPERFINRIDLPTPFVRNVGLKPNNKHTSFVADICAEDLWLKRHLFTNIKSPKVICRAVHDATLACVTNKLRTLVTQVYFFITDSNF